MKIPEFIIPKSIRLRNKNREIKVLRRQLDAYKSVLQNKDDQMTELMADGLRKGSSIAAKRMVERRKRLTGK